MPKKRKPTEHVWIPDTQLRPGVPTSHLPAAANYIAEHTPDVIVIGGDWWDLPSLSSYEKPGSKWFEGRRVTDDIAFGNDAMAEFMRPIERKRGYNPRLVFIEGNHEYRMQRFINDDPVSREGVYGRDMFYIPKGMEYHNFLDIVTIDGIMYSHYFCNPQSLMRGVLGGQMDNRLNKLKASFTQGHQQTHMTGSQYLADGSRIRGLVSGAFYQHDEEYAGPQGHNYWRGISYKHEVRDGNYDLMELSLDYLVRKWS